VAAVRGVTDGRGPTRTAVLPGYVDRVSRAPAGPRGAAANPEWPSRDVRDGRVKSSE
jgi:hypothetical protein